MTVRSHPRLYVVTLGSFVIIHLVILFFPGVECSECTAWGSLRVHLGVNAAAAVTHITLLTERQSDDGEVRGSVLWKSR